MKLLYKFALITFTIGIPTIILVSFFSFNSIKDALQQSITNQQIELARQSLDKIDRLLYERLNNIATIAQDEQIEGLLVKKSKPTPDLTTTNAQKLRKLSLLTGPWDNLIVVNTNGEIVTTLVSQANIGQDIRKYHLTQDTFAKVVSGSVYYSDVFFDSQLQKPTMIFAAPVRDSEDPKQPIIGITVGELSWPVVLQILQGTSARDISLYTNKGVKIGDNTTENLASFPEEDSSPAIQHALGHTEGSQIVTDNKNKEEELASFVQEKGYLNFGGNNWVLVIQTPTNLAFAPAAGTAINSSVFLIIIIFLSNSMFLFFMLRLLTPIGLLTKTIRTIAEGDYTKRVKIRSSDEIGELAMAFNHMADKLQEVHNDLEDKVRLRTSLLAQKVTEIAEAKAKDDAVITSIGDSLVIVDNTGNILLVNPAAEHLLGIRLAKIVRQSFYTVIPIFDDQDNAIPKEKNPVYIALAEHKKDVQTYVYKKDEGSINITITATPIIKQQEIIGVIAIIRDITKEREIDRMKTEFISLASHQLRTPLSAIRWFVEMLLNGDGGPLNNEQKEFAQNISDSTQRMIDLVGSLLNISRIESGRIMIDPHPTDVKELVQEVIVDLQAKIAERNQHIAVSIHDQLPKINLDPKLIRQVYMNLLTNAIKYTPKGGQITIIVSQQGDELLSQINDTGYGIPKKEQDKVFQRFFRGENVVKVESDGTGLGLYLIKAIVESSHGRIWFISEENKGTTFWFSLPMSGMAAKKGEVTLDS